MWSMAACTWYGAPYNYMHALPHPGSVAMWDHHSPDWTVSRAAIIWWTYDWAVTPGYVGTPPQHAILAEATLAAPSRGRPDSIVAMLHRVVTPTQHAPARAKHCIGGSATERDEEERWIFTPFQLFLHPPFPTPGLTVTDTHPWSHSHWHSPLVSQSLTLTPGLTVRCILPVANSDRAWV